MYVPTEVSSDGYQCVQCCKDVNCNVYCTQQDQRKAHGNENTYAALKPVSHSLTIECVLCFHIFNIKTYCLFLNYRMLQQTMKWTRRTSLQRVRSTGHQLPIHEISMTSCPGPSFERSEDNRFSESQTFS